MKRFISAAVKILFLLILCFNLFIISCKTEQKRARLELIQPLLLTAGVSDTIVISDIFFSQDYSLHFESHPDITVQYEPLLRQLVLTPNPASEGLTLLKFLFHQREHVVPVQINRWQEYTFRFRPPRSGKMISVFGSFNSWNRENQLLHDHDGDGIYETTVYLEPGRYEYKFYLDGEEILDMTNPDKVSNPFGSFNSVLTIPPRYLDRLYLHLLGFRSTADTLTLSFLFQRTPQQTEVKKDEIVALLDNFLLSPDYFRVQGNKIECHLPLSLLAENNIFRMAVAQGGLFTAFQTIRLNDGKPQGVDKDSFDWPAAILYAIMIDRFKDGDPGNTQRVQHQELDPKANFFGGDIQGIIQKLEEGYFQDLGVNVLWLSPVNQNTWGAFREYPPPHRYFTGYHGYWPIHYQQVDKRFGDRQVFKKMVDIAHRQGIRVILDFVANHVHQEHPFYQHHPEWFGSYELPDGRKNIRLWDEYRLTTWFDTFLPSFDYEGSQEALEVMTDNAVWWVKQTGIDGFRQDAVKHVPNSFWRTLTYKLKEQIESKENRQLFQIGETFGSYQLIKSYVSNGQLNSQFNFNLYDAAIYVFLTPEASFQILDGEMNKTFSMYGVNHVMGNLMDSHDKVRYIAYADGDISLSTPDAAEVGWSHPPQVDDPMSYQKTRLYQAYLLSIPGIPVIYYGDEIGLSGAADPDNRRPMKFGEELNADQKHMLQEVKKIIHLRRDHSALLYGDFLTLHADEKIYAYLRSDAHERILIVLNKSHEPVQLHLKIPSFYSVKKAVNLRDNTIIDLEEDRLSLEIAPIDWRYFQLLP